MKTITNITYSTFALFAFACIALSPNAKAVDPPPDRRQGEDGHRCGSAL